MLTLQPTLCLPPAVQGRRGLPKFCRIVLANLKLQHPDPLTDGHKFILGVAAIAVAVMIILNFLRNGKKKAVK